MRAHMGNVNRKATAEEMERARDVICRAFPDCEPIFGGHSAYGGSRAPRDHTISFRLRDQAGKYRSNVVWLLPEWLAVMTPADVRSLVARANGGQQKKKKRR